MKMLVVDLAGSALCHADNRVADVDVQAAKRLSEAGVIVTIATGRLFPGCINAAAALGVSGPVCVMNGSALHQVGSGQVVSASPLSDLSLQAIRVQLKNRGLPPLLYQTDGVHYPTRHHDRHGDYFQMWSPSHRHTPALIDVPWSGQTLAVSSFGDQDAIEEVAQVLAGVGLGTRCFNTFTGERFVEVRVDGLDKGVGLNALCKAHNITPDECVVMGDWWNDVPMFKRAGRSFVMAESDDDVTAEATDRLKAVRGQGGGIAEIARRVWNL